MQQLSKGEFSLSTTLKQCRSSNIPLCTNCTCIPVTTVNTATKLFFNPNIMVVGNQTSQGQNNP